MATSEIITFVRKPDIQQQSRLLRLATELRLEIWQYVVSETIRPKSTSPGLRYFQNVDKYFDGGLPTFVTASIRKPTEFSLSATCQQVYNEVTFKFHFDGWLGVTDYLSLTNSLSMATIHSVTIDVWLSVESKRDVEAIKEAIKLLQGCRGLRYLCIRDMQNILREDDHWITQGIKQHLPELRGLSRFDIWEDELCHGTRKDQERRDWVEIV